MSVPAVPSVFSARTIIVVVCFLSLQAQLTSQAPTDTCSCHLDVGVVGAGPAGAYSAYKLKDKNLKVGVYEFSNRIGGRLFSTTMPNIPDKIVELGGMRFIDNIHVNMKALAVELNLAYTPFLGGTPGVTPHREYRRNVSMTSAEFSYGDVPYNLTAEEKSNQGDLLRYYLKKLTNDPLDGLMTDEKLLQLTVPDGRKLYTLSVPEAIGLVASSEGAAYLLTQDHFNSPEISMADYVQYVYGRNGLAYTPEDLLTITDGLAAVPRTAIQRFLQASSSHTMTYNRRLVAINNKPHGGYQLVFRKTVTVDDVTDDVTEEDNEEIVCAKKVILAIPNYALRRVDWSPLKAKAYTDLLDGTKLVPSSKVYMAFPRAWWLEDSLYPARKLVADTMGEICDWGVTHDGYFTILISYNKHFHTKEQFAINEGLDGYYPGALDDILRNGSHANPLHSQNLNLAPIPGSVVGENQVTAPLKDYILDELANVFGVPRDKIPEPVAAISRFWIEYPWGGAWAFTRPGYIYEDLVSGYRRPSDQHDVFVVGADYVARDMTGWTEGALETAKSVIDEFF